MGWREFIVPILVAGIRALLRLLEHHVADMPSDDPDLDTAKCVHDHLKQAEGLVTKTCPEEAGTPPR